MPLNETVERVTLHLHLSGASSMWWSLQLGLRQQVEMQQKWGVAKARTPPQSTRRKRTLLHGCQRCIVRRVMRSAHTVPCST